jgi:hypothetical protein
MSVTEEEKSIQGTIAENEKTTYGTPPVSTWINNENTTVKTATVAAG